MAESKEEYENSKGIMVSYGCSQLYGQWITGAFGIFVLYFYEVEIGLDTLLVSTAFILYSIWNAINDPLSGYLVERLNMPWQKKWGYKRLPWILLLAVPWLFTYLMIFLVPSAWLSDVAANQWPIFGWYLGSLCLYDTLFTLWNINSTALYPDKFRGLNERRTATGIGTIIGMIGIVLAMVVPPLLVTKGDVHTYRTMAWICVGIGILLFFTMLPGVWEKKSLRDYYARQKELATGVSKEPFFKTMKRVLSNRIYIVKVIFFFGYQAAAALIQASAPYVVTFVLDADPFVLTIILGGMLLGALISIYFWLRFAKKVNDNKKMSLIAGWVMFLTFIPLIFGQFLGFIGWIISMILWGVGLGGQWFMDPPTMGDTLDYLTIRYNKRENSVYYGWNAFIIRLSGVFTAVVFGIVHPLTGFEEGAPTLADLITANPTGWQLAVFGIIIHAAIIPAVLVLVTILIFRKYYTLTPKVVAENKKKLKELGL
ncbi:MAG: MFS transporter [Candidatus Lokiarchaeota archaeon]|nr:MFS transporter [Candidatus Lokiarchaeota archaeon]